MNAFTIDLSDLKKIKRFFKNSPHDFRRATANVLTSLAFKTREYDIRNLSDNMIIRNPKFLRSSLKVDKAKSENISNQIARAYSIYRPGFTGWEEQQEGKRPDKDRAGTIASRGGNIRGRMRPRARLKSSNKFYKPEQFRHRTRRGQFGFMLRVMATRGGGEFLLSDSIPTRRGTIQRGLYEFRKHRIKRLQKIGNVKQPRSFHWRDQSLRQLNNKNDIKKIWQESINRTVARYKK